MAQYSYTLLTGNILRDLNNNSELVIWGEPVIILQHSFLSLRTESVYFLAAVHTVPSTGTLYHPQNRVPSAGLEPSARPRAGLEPSARPCAVLEPIARPCAVLEPSGRPCAVLEPSARPCAG